MSGRTIVMTGGTSGLGEVAAHRMAAAGDVRLLVGARRAGGGRDVLPLDLADLRSVRQFATGVIDAVGSGRIDGLVLNAGLAFNTASERTVDGYETTFAVNHLAHQLLARLLLVHLAPGALIVVTTSGVHDPAANAPIPPPRHADAELLAHPDRDPNLHAKPKDAGGHAYAASKLCNLLTVRALAAQPVVTERGITVVAFDPGAVPGTGLSKSYSPAIKAVWWLLGTPVGRLVPSLSSRRTAGTALANLALGQVPVPPGEYYARQRKCRIVWDEPSALARDDAARDTLWAASVKLAETAPLPGAGM